MHFAMRFTVAGLVLAAVISGPALSLLGEGRLAPAWARSWRDTGPPAAKDYGGGISLADLNDLRYGARLSARGSRQDRTAIPQNTLRLRRSILTACMAAGDRFRQGVLTDWQSHLRDLAARKLAAARLAWEERFRDRAIELGRESDEQLRAYAAEVRRAYFSRVSELEMRVAMTADAAAKQALEADLAKLHGEIESKVSAQKGEIAERCRQELAAFQRLAEESIAYLEEALRQEADRSLASFLILQQEVPLGPVF